MADENTPIRGSARSTQRIGLVVAVSVALVGTGILGLLATRGGGPAPGGSAKGGKGPTPAPPAPVVPPPVDITQTGLAEVGKARVQYVDRRNPGRVAGLIQWSKIDPLPNGRALVERPQGVIFLADGRQLVFNAATGRLFTRPGATEPESGLFEGGVPVALYAARTDGRPIDTATDRPVAMFFAQTISFDLGLGELSTPDEFRASGPTFDFKGRGLRLVFDQVAERIALLSVEKTDFLRYATDTDASSASAPAGGTAAKPATSPTNPVDPAPPTLTGPSTVYAAAIDRAVTVRQGQRTLVGASLAGLLRINAAQQQQGTERVAATGLPAPPPASPASTPSSLAGVTAVPAPAGSAPTPATISGPITPGLDVSLATEREQDLLVTFAGPFVLRPAQPQAADGLPDDENLLVTLRGGAAATADAPRRVTLRDPALGLQGEADELRVEGTARAVSLVAAAGDSVLLTMTGSRSEPASTSPVLGQSGVLSTTWVRASFRDGVVDLGPGLLVADRPADAPASAGTAAASLPGPNVTPFMHWTGTASLSFAMADGRMTDRLERAEFGRAVGVPGVRPGEGRVTVGDAQGRLSAGEAVVLFMPPSPNAKAGGLALQRLTLGRNAELLAANGSLTAEAMDVTFAPSEFARDGRTATRPADLLARGQVVARDAGGSRLSSGTLDAVLGLSDSGQTVVQTIDAGGGVDVVQGDTRIRTPRLRADVSGQIADLIGEGTTLELPRLRLTGTQMRADGIKRELFVHGAGRIDAEPPGQSGSAASAASAPSGGTVAVTWASSLIFNDRTGSADVRGTVRAVFVADPQARDVIEGDRVQLTFTPAATGAAAAAAPAGAMPVASAGPERRLLRAEVTGRSVEETGGAMATVDSRRFAPPPEVGETPLQRLVYLQSDRIVADLVNQTITTPGAGRLLVDERSGRRFAAVPVQPSAPRAQQDGLFNSSGSADGTTLMNWSQSLTFSRTQGELDMQGGVRLIHRPAGGGPVVTMLCNRGRAFIRERTSDSAAATAPAAASAQLLRASAEGDVQVSTPDGKRMIADTLTYDPLAGSVTAQAGGPTLPRATFEDPAKPPPVAAEKLVWFLRDGRVEVTNPAPVVVPVPPR
jgi:hypothetical protein